MEKSDLRDVARLEQECFSQPWSESGIGRALDDGRFVFVVAKRGGELAGYAGMQYILDEGYVENIAVFESARREGVGRALLEALTAAAREKGLRFLTLEARESNGAAIALYAEGGFERVGVRRGFYDNPREDAVLMTRFFEQNQSGGDALP